MDPALDEEQRREWLAQMYPEGQPLGGVERPGEAMVSLPGRDIGSELRAAPTEAQEVAPQPAPQPSVRVTREQPPSGGGGVKLNLARGLYAFGGGDVAAYDRAQQERAEAPARLKMQQMDLEDKQRERSTKLQDIREAMDPNSPASMAAADEYARVNAARAEVLKDKNPRLAQVFADAAANAKGKSRLQLANAENSHKQVMGEILKMIDADARSQLASQGRELQARGVAAQERLANSTISDRREDNALARERLDFDKQKEGNKATRVHLTVDQQKLIGEMAGNLNQVQVLDSLIPEADDYAKNASNIPGLGKSGILSGPVQTLKSMANPSTDPKYNTFRANVQRLFSVERKVFAGSNVTDTEMKNLAPMIPDFNKDSEQTIRDKLAAARDWLKKKTDTDMSRLQYDAQGNPLDQSLLAQMLKEQAPKATTSNPAIRQAAGKPAAATAPVAPSDPAQVERARKAAAAGNAKAAQWLKENGHAP